MSLELEPATGADESEQEKCVGEGGHFWLDEPEQEDPAAYRCERCGAVGYVA